MVFPASHRPSSTCGSGEAVATYLSAHPVDAIISSLPYFCNPTVATLALKHGCHYFDLTEDVEVTDQIRTMAEGAAHAFMPQCGLAPGFISVVTHDLMTHFETLDHVKMRVGAFPVHPSNALKYSLTWSTDGLINEYGNLCYGIEEGRKIPLQPLEGYETIELDGLLYEAFNTSGGLGTLADSSVGRVKTMNYKTLRYPGHCEKIHLLMKDLRLNEDRKTLKRVLEHAIPQTLQDVVLIYASVTGTKQGEFFEESYVKKVYPQCIKGKLWSAIQVTTASSVCCVMDLVLRHPHAPRGFVTQESIPLERFSDQRLWSLLPMSTIHAALKALGIQAVNSGGSTGKHWWSDHAAGSLLQSVNPATGEAIAAVRSCAAQDYEHIVAQVRETFTTWRTVPAPKRGELVRLIGHALREKKDQLGTLVSLEVGKIKAEGDGEVQEMIDMADFAVGQSRMLYGATMQSERPAHRMSEQWHPLGPVGVITAFNFPVAVWAWNAFLAAIAGDPVIWKPSPKAPLCAIAVQQICNQVMEQQGYSGIFSLFITDQPSLAETMVRDPRLPLISFTGSVPVGRHVAALVGQRLGRTLLELSGNNAVIVDDSADMDLAVRAIVFGAVGTAGQRCTTTRRVLVHESCADELLDRLVKAYKQVRIGNPLDADVLLGPLIDHVAVETYRAAIDEIKKEGGDILYGGRVLSRPGYFVEPTIVRAKPQWPLVQRETFAPILYVMTYRTLDEALAIQNGVPQGLSSAIFTNNLRHGERFVSASGSDCGIANVNIGTSGAEIGGAFGGEKETGGGREAGSDAWKAYMRRQTNTVNWGTDLPLAQGIKFGS